MAKGKLNWSNVEDIAFRLIDEYPQVNPLKLRMTELHKYITKLPDFSDDPKKSNEAILENIMMTWFEERQEMEDELGPLPADEEELDEDDFREDRMIDDEEELDDEDDDEDEDEFEDGFQEEEIDDR